MSRARNQQLAAARPDRDNITIAELNRRPPCTLDTAVVINRLAVRADDIHIGHRDRRLLE